MRLKRIADPVHGTIELSPVEVAILQTLTFQRLRGVKQLGLANLVFPGADYSRFAHCVGACHVVQRLIGSLARAGCEISSDDAAMYRAAALLHDLGHYPFSHATEHAVRDHYAKSSLLVENEAELGDDRGSGGSPYNHEELGSHLIAESGEIASVLSKFGIDPDKIVAIISHHVNAPPYANLISSDLDADRIDYLLRTAHHTGLPYGHIDTDYLFAMLKVDNEAVLCFDERAMRTAEHLLLARYFDYQQVSFHKTVAGYEILLADVLGALIRNGLLDCSREAIDAESSDPTRWVSFDDAYVTERMRRYIRELPDDGVDVGKARAILSRTGMKLVWSREIFAERGNTELLALQERMILGEVERIANAAGVPVDHVSVWHRRTALTSMGSRVRASRLREIDDEELARYGQSVRIEQDGGSSIPLAECDSSIYKVLGDWSLDALRVYVLPQGGTLDASTTRSAVDSVVGR